MTATAERLLHQADWPGNVRELRNVIERACILCDGRMITERELSGAMSVLRVNTDASPRLDDAPAEDAADSSLMSTAQRGQITKVLRQVNGNKAAAAKQLGISRRSLYRWLDRLNIPQ